MTLDDLFAGLRGGGLSRSEQRAQSAMHRPASCCFFAAAGTLRKVVVLPMRAIGAADGEITYQLAFEVELVCLSSERIDGKSV